MRMFLFGRWWGSVGRFVILQTTKFTWEMVGRQEEYKLNIVLRNLIPELAIREPDCVLLYGSVLINAYSHTLKLLFIGNRFRCQRKQCNADC